MATVSEALATAVQQHQAGRLHDAEQVYRRILAVEPNQADALHLLGVIAHQVGNHALAVAYITRAIGSNGTVAAFHSNLGNALKGQGKLDEAVACFRRALELKPAYAEAHNNLGNAFAGRGELDEAAACYRRALELKPDSTEVNNNLGAVFQGLGELDAAAACYRRALELKPDSVETHNNLGAALHGQGKLDEEVACYRRALELKPNYAAAHNNLGAALQDQKKLDEAAACYRRALELKPDFPEAHNNLGAVLQGQGKLDEALACCRRALELKADFDEAHNNLGNILQDQGKLEEAVASYRRVLQIELGRRAAQARPQHGEVHDSFGNAFCQLATILRSRFPEDDLRTGRQLLSEAKLGDDGRAALELGLAEVLDARGDYGEAAEHLREAGTVRLAVLQKRGQAYDPADYGSFVDGVISTFTPEFFARANGFGLETELPVFVFGLPRSGSTLVEQILASHSLVFGAGELHYCEETFQSLPKAMSRCDTPLKCLPELDRETSRYLAGQHVERLRTLDARALRIVDKLPENYPYLGFINALFPRARLIHCRRDLRDVALSCRMTHFAAVPWACDPDHIIFHVGEYSRLMDHWRKVLPAPILDVDYEETVEDTAGVARRIVAWCGLPWEPGCLRFYETQRPVRTASAAQVRRPIYKSSLGRWKNYEQPLGELFSRVHQLDKTRLLSSISCGEPVGWDEPPL
ncbi:MAG: tetratricopeptide repeat-containing sulfotransferase family protein [Thermoguttaceae bacterium]